MTTGAREQPSEGEPQIPSPRGVRLLLDPSYRRPDDGLVVIGGSPLRLLTLTAAGADVMRAIEANATIDPASRAAAALVDRLLDLGIVHPVHHNSGSDTAVANGSDSEGRATPGMTIVTPVLRTGHSTVSIPRWASTPAVVVDDGSDPPLGIDDVPSGALLVRLDRNVGPGAARMAGLAEVRTPFVAFVDADVEIDEAELRSLLAWFDDPKVALVAPRIRAAAPGPTGRGSVLARFEADRSPLDLGPTPARIAATTRVSYVPAAAIVCRTEAVRAVGGFDPALRWGEDVDLVWRLHEAGWRCRYEPSVLARHRTRDSLGAWVVQRFRYGTSAAPLAERHPGALAPVRMSGWSAATWVPAVFGWPLVGALIGVGSSLALVRTLRQVPASESFRLAGMGNVYAGRLWAETLTRAWWPIALVAAVTVRRSRPALLAAVLVPIALDQRSAGKVRQRDHQGHERPSVDAGTRLDPVRAAALHLLDDVSYGAGVWAGAWRHRSLAALMPSFESWPPRGRPGGSTSARTMPQRLRDRLPVRIRRWSS